MLSDRDSVADPGSPIPDHVPDELVERYGRDAGHVVRYHRSPRYRVGRRVSRVSQPFRSADVWTLSLMIFFWGVIAATIVGGLAYAISLMPWVAVYVGVPLAALFAGSVGLAAWIVKRRPRPTEDTVITLP